MAGELPDFDLTFLNSPVSAGADQSPLGAEPAEALLDAYSRVVTSAVAKVVPAETPE